MWHRTYSPGSWIGHSAPFESKGSISSPISTILSSGTVAPLSSNPSPACRSYPRETLFHGVPGQSPEVATGATNDSPMAGHPMAPTDRTLAGVPKHPAQNPVVYPPAPSRRPHHPQASGGSGGSDQLCLSGAQPFESLPSTADSQSVPGLSPRQRHLSTHSSTSPPCPAVLGG